LPREITYNVISDEPTHIDFLRVVPGVKIRIEVPVVFINHETSPGLKRGGVLNIVRREVELKCPSEKIPSAITIDLDGVDIGESFKISSVKLEEGVTPTIIGRDFVIATLAAPTVMKEPEKPAEAEEEQQQKMEKKRHQQLRVIKKMVKRKKPLKKNNQLIIVKPPRYDLKKICFYL